MLLFQIRNECRMNAHCVMWTFTWAQPICLLITLPRYHVLFLPLQSYRDVCIRGRMVILTTTKRKAINSFIIIEKSNFYIHCKGVLLKILLLQAPTRALYVATSLAIFNFCLSQCHSVTTVALNRYNILNATVV